MEVGGPHGILPGSSIERSNELGEQLERRAAEIDASLRGSFFGLQLGFDRLHDAAGAALAGDAAAAAGALAAGLLALGRCNDELTALTDALARDRGELPERDAADSADPLVSREPFFAALDYEAIYRELLGEGAALPLRAFWDDLAARLRDGGTHAGLRLLDRQLRELRSDLHLFVAGAEESMARPQGGAGAPAAHDLSTANAKLMFGYTRVLATFTCFTILCERASALQEGALMAQEVAAAAS